MLNGRVAAGAVVRMYLEEPVDTTSDGVIALLVDLRHYCANRSLDFAELDRRAGSTYKESSCD